MLFNADVYSTFRVLTSSLLNKVKYFDKLLVCCANDRKEALPAILLRCPKLVSLQLSLFQRPCEVETQF